MLRETDRKAGESGKDYAYRVIRANIMDLTLVPGRAISEIELAAALQLSRTPVREVVSRLKEEYLVDVVPQVGTYISKIDAQLIEEAAFMRLTLEQEVLRLVCRSLPSDILLELRHNLRQQEDVRDHAAGAAAFHELDNAFHRLLFRGCGKEHVWDSITRLSTHYNRMRLLFETEHPFDEAIEQHRQWIELIAEGHVDAVERAVHEHIRQPILYWKTLLGSDDRYSGFFKTSDVFEVAASDGLAPRNTP